MRTPPKTPTGPDCQLRSIHPDVCGLPGGGSGFPQTGTCDAPAGYDSCYDLGQFNLGDPPFSMTFFLQNHLSEPLAVDGFQVLTGVPALWQIDTSECRGKVLQPGQSCPFTVTFIPPGSAAPAPTPGPTGGGGSGGPGGQPEPTPAPVPQPTPLGPGSTPKLPTV